MLNSLIEPAGPRARLSFRASFKAVAAFYGRPSSDTVLFSGLPDEIVESLELDDVEHVAERIGLQVMRVGERAIRENDFDCPAIVVLKDGGTLPLLEVTDDGIYTLDIREGTAAARLTHQRAELALSVPVSAALLSPSSIATTAEDMR
jgi:ATP-binding cassette subfamily C protein LapB